MKFRIEKALKSIIEISFRFLSALIVVVYEDPVVPEQAATVTEKLGEYLISVGY